MGTGGRLDVRLRLDFGFRPKLRPQKAELSNFDTKMHSATRRVFWDASRRRWSHPEAETAEIRRPLWLQPRVVRRAGLRILFLSNPKESQEAFGLSPRCPDLPSPAKDCVISHRFFSPRWPPDGSTMAKMARLAVS